MRRALPAVGALVLAASIAFGVTSAGGTGLGSDAAAAGLLLGVSGNPVRFENQTGQDSIVVETFLGWEQGVSWGSKLDVLIPTLAPVPMLHLGVKGRDGREAITPGGIAAGQGDSYLIALGQAIARWGKGIYIRPMAEMNNSGNGYSGYGPDGKPRNAAHSPAVYRKAFARIYLILHGGSARQVNARLRLLGLPPVRDGDLVSNPFPRLRILWSPLAGGTPKVPGNAPEMYYPGRAYVDVEGGDIYDETLGDNGPWPDLEALYRLALAHRKPFSVPEWGLFSVDDPAFVQHMCTFLQTHRASEMQAFFEGVPGSVFNIESKPKSRATYRKCMLPLGGPLPSWASASAGVSAIALTLTPNPASGPSPLAVQFTIAARLSVPVARWQIFFGDGKQVGGAGQPPATVQHAFPQDGIYEAALVVYPSPPFVPEAASFLTSADVTVGTAATPVVSFEATPTSGPVPLKVSFRTDLGAPGTAAGWRIAFGDSNTLDGSGAPPRFIGHTYRNAGTYRVILVLDGSPSGRSVALADVTAGTGTSGKPPPATATRTGTVLVDGAPFAGGTVPYGSKVDVTNGTLKLKTDTGTLRVFGAGVSAEFVLRRGTDGGKPVVELRLAGGDFKVCSNRKKSSVVKTPPKTVRQLWGNGQGRFRTRGRYVSAVVLGTVWLTADRCDGSLVTVKRGRVRVADLVKKTNVVVRTGHTYLAKKP